MSGLSLAVMSGENDKLEALCGSDDWTMRMDVRPGPLGLLRHAPAYAPGSPEEETLIGQLAGLVIRYGKKVHEGPLGSDVLISRGGQEEVRWQEPLLGDELEDWRI